MSYRDTVEAHKQANIDNARESGHRLRDINFWDQRRSHIAEHMRGKIARAIESTQDTQDPQLSAIVLMTRADMLGVSEKGIRMPGRLDRTDAGPEIKLHTLLEDRWIAERDRKIAIAFCVLNTMYKITKWESTTQMKNLQETLGNAEEWHIAESMESLMLLQGTSAYCQASIETDLETKQHLQYNGNYTALQKQFAEFETLNLPFPDGN